MSNKTSKYKSLLTIEYSFSIIHSDTHILKSLDHSLIHWVYHDPMEDRDQSIGYLATQLEIPINRPQSFNQPKASVR